jgi:hypothetical protein
MCGSLIFFTMSVTADVTSVTINWAYVTHFRYHALTTLFFPSPDDMAWVTGSNCSLKVTLKHI